MYYTITQRLNTLPEDLILYPGHAYGGEHDSLKQLLVGRDIGQNSQFGKQMENFVYVIGDSEKKECLVVDPAWDISGLINYTNNLGYKITGALATHYHPDHIGGDIFGHSIEGLPELQKLNPCKVHAHKLECDGIRQVTNISKSDLVPHDSADIVKAGDIQVEILHTPGHTPGSICFRFKDSLVSGDTLFLQGCGRVDLPGGDCDQMYYTITQRLNTLPEDLILYPGHAYGGEHDSLKQVRKHNQMLKSNNLQDWRAMHGQ